MNSATGKGVGPAAGRHPGEPHDEHSGAEWLNRLRAGVLGANDGIVSTAALVIGVAGANASRAWVATAGLAGIVAGAMSMAVGEYVSVSSHRDTEEALLAKERGELADDPEGEWRELRTLYMERGLTEETAGRVADELTANDALAAHAEIELNIRESDRVSPWGAAITSFVAFAAGSLLPFVAIVASPQPVRVAVTFVAVLAALLVTGTLSARISNADPRRAVPRIVAGGLIAMVLTYAVGVAVGSTF